MRTEYASGAELKRCAAALAAAWLPLLLIRPHGFEYLAATVSNIKTEAPAYAANRKQAAHVLNKLSAEYMVKEKEKKAKAVSGKKRDLPEPDDSSDPPTDSDEDEDDDE